MMMRTFRLLTPAIVLIISTIPSVYAAQVNMMPTLTLSEEYTDNLFLVSDDNNKVDEYITTVGVGLSTEVLGQTAGLTLNLAPTYNKFADNEDLDYWRYYAGLNVWTMFRRNTRLELNSIYLETEDPRDRADDGAEGESGAETGIDVDVTRRDRNRYLRNTNELRLSHQYGNRSSLYGAVAYNLHRDIDQPDGTELDDYDEIKPSFGIEHWFSTWWGFEIDTNYSDRSYEDRDDRSESYGSVRLLRNFNRHLSGYIKYQYTHLDFDQETDNQDYTISAPSIGLEYQLAEASSLRIGAGYYTQDFKEGDDDTGSFIDAALSNRWDYKTGYVTVVVSSGYDVEDTGAEDLGLQIYYKGRVEAGYDFTNRFSGDIYASYRHDDYPNQDPDRSDQTLNAGAGISYQALRWMRLRLSYDYDNVVSDVETEEFTENSVLFTITMAPSSPFRLN